MQELGRYLFLASAIAGRRIGVHSSTDGGPLACSDNHSIFLPPSAQPLDQAWPQVVAQAALIGSGSLEAYLMRRLLGRPDAARRYAYLEVLRASQSLSARLPSAFLDLAPIKHAQAMTRTATESADWALGRAPLPEPPDFFGSVRPLITLRKAVGEDGISALTRKRMRGNHEKPEAVEEFDDDDATEESKLLRLFQNPLMGSNPLSDLIDKILGAGSSRGNRDPKPQAGGGAEAPVGRVIRALRRGVHAIAARLPFELPEIESGVGSTATIYPEWDALGNIYRPGHVFVEDVEAWRLDGARALDEIVKPVTPELRRQLRNLGLDHEIHRRQREGTELDIGPLLECAIDLATGHSPATLDIYRASRRTRRDLAVVIALDVSGSTGEQNRGGVSVFDQQLRIAYELGHVLSGLGDTVALFGFHSWGRHLVHAVRIKGAEERWSARVAERFSQLEPVGYTRTGAAIRHGARMLQTAMRLPNRLLLLITDGIPYDQDYESAYAEGDTLKALEEARAGGTACVCLCVGGGSDTATLRKIFGAANLLIIDESRQITRHIRAVCQQSLSSVSKRMLGR